MKRSVSAIIAVAVVVTGFAATGNCDEFTPAEQELIKKGLTMEAYRPDSEVSHEVETIHGSKGSGPILVFIFGRGAAEAARSAGHKAATAGYNAPDAERVLLGQARAKCPRSPFFVQCFMREAATVYNARK